MKRLILLLIICLSITLYAEKDTVEVAGYYSTNTYGTLNDAIDLARTNGTINNTVFKLAPYEVYVLSRSIFMDLDQNLEIVAPKPGLTQETAPPQIVWTEEAIDRNYIIQTYGNVVLKNLWIRHADILGSQRSTSITFEDSSAQGDDKESGYFENCLFDYCPIGSDAAGVITVKANHFTGKFQDCYFRNLSDPHFQYYGRAVSYPYQSTGYHCDTLMFENCSFSNLSRVVMQEGNEFADNIFLNHCTLFNSVEWVIQSGRTDPEGWLRNISITNSLFVNPYMFGYTALEVCKNGESYKDFEAGLCNPVPTGGLISNVQSVDSFGFAVDFTNLDRKMYIGNIAYVYQDWLKDYMNNCPWCKTQVQGRHPEELHHPAPMIDANAKAQFDSLDGSGNKVFKTMNIDYSTIYSDDPGFVVPPINEDTLKLFLEGRWNTGLDINWAYDPNSGFVQKWPLPEDLAFTNEAYKSAAMGSFPMGDLRWFPSQKESWKAQRELEWTNINAKLNALTGVKEIPNSKPMDYALNQNYPNPFNPVTNIKYSIPVSGFVSLKVYNSIGQLVATIFDGYQNAGSYIAEFDASKLSSGIYMYQMQSGNVSITKKLVLMK